MNAPELLAPAGTLKNLRYALAYGADAVYAGMPRYSLRVRNNEFAALEALAEGIRLTHAAGRRFFLAANISAHQPKLATFARDMAPVVALQPDALIMSDPGLIMQVRERWPEMPVHLSVQANTVNAASVRFWQGLGLTRVILSRELSLGEIESIRQDCPDMELEVMVHGAMCIAYSGRCLLSGYFNHRDANQGACTNACRWQYRLHAAEEDTAGDLVPRDAPPAPDRHALAGQPFLLEEGERPGQLMPVEEDEHGTYILNSMDLRAVEHVQRLVAIGVDALKIEGRTKSHYYAARTAQVYRRAIDDATAGRAFDPALLEALEGLANRGYTDGFLTRPRERTAQNYVRGHSESDRRLFVGEIEAYDPVSGMARVDVKNRFGVGDRLEIITPEGSREIVLEAITGREGLPVAQAPGAGHRVSIPLPPGDYHMGLILRQVEPPSP
ncbi:tRNA 5-hydroxyuridine modification protein YegQ [Ectothiorhodospira haloalkaliphila]|uniref:prephenate-dependent tRNA uridine(34) hydroxylase TrhP n=1 Tax=Ectothiorhodospira haloalkaliphila TaxID=421628 RepID=UPI001EE9651C|nr:tRNA 5-hydroxyuridine modification protein YegQ [Ectothiorhodospira haloalkaliphila]MCG5525136.1 tRNA 5-hydroxyuridine modification protein YegQ [Ectothiorhodospira haloalkaliphila]